ncbi:MAG TPA: hypothetical protein DCS20_02755 [Candidatus Yonathbacteria bacterium]|nr:hypothetical protein [Candidatus Yonathbacteria bacterium]
MKALRFQVQTNTSSILMGIALRDIEDGTAVADHLPYYELPYYEPEDQYGFFTDDDFDQPDDLGLSHYDDFDYRAFEEQVLLPEDLWEGETSDAMPETGGIELLRWLMEGVKASEIRTMPATWVAVKFCCFSALIHGAQFDISICDDPSQIIGRYAVALESCLRGFGVEFKIFGGITEAGFQRLVEIQQQELAPS